jgi:2'-hydroxyisoflavone reductase
MRILIIGGAVFLGRTIAEIALKQGHSLTLFNRGKSNPELFPQAERLIGDRSIDLSPLEGRQWDAVIDTCGYLPGDARRSAQALASAVDHYTFISTAQVYADLSKPAADEEAALASLKQGNSEELSGETYGPLKALCEQEVMKVFPGRALIVRPGLIVGPYDPSDRFAYWLQRVAEGGEVLVPGPPDRPIQFIDGRDLAEWILRMAAERQAGTYNAIGPENRMHMEEFLQICKSITQSDASFTWVDDPFLLEHKVEPWSDMPLWIPHDHPSLSQIFTVSGEKARGDGLTHRSVDQTVRDMLQWIRARPEGSKMRLGISRQRER